MKAFWNTFYRFKGHHVVLWLLYFAFWAQFYIKYYPTIISLLASISVYFLSNAICFYITGYYLFPQYLYKKKYARFILLLLAVILLLSAGLAVCIYFMFLTYSPDTLSQIPALFPMALLSNSTVTGLLCAIKLAVDKMRQDNLVQEQDKQRLESELQYLKAQVNPHFLFNAINSVYFLIKKDPNVAAETLIKLSDLLRFQLYDCSDDQIPIEKELEYLNNFVSLEKIRKGKKIITEFVVEEGISGFTIAPFLLIPFLENAFKHVSNFPERDNQIVIRFQRDQERFKATFFNTTDNLKHSEVGGIGLKNVKRRLELLYPGRHTLSIHDEPGTFCVDLSITIV